MPEAYIRRGSALAPNQFNKPQANTVRVDTTANEVKVGSGTSGTTELTLVDTSTAQSLANKNIQSVLLASTGALVLTAALHAGKTIIHNEATGRAYTLPAATGTGNKYRIVVGVTLTGGSLAVAVPNATDFFRGRALFQNDTDGSASNFETANTGTVATESDTATLNRTTTGLGTIGDELVFEDIASAVWLVRIEAQASGSEATPFSAAV